MADDDSVALPASATIQITATYTTPAGPQKYPAVTRCDVTAGKGLQPCNFHTSWNEAVSMDFAIVATSGFASGVTKVLSLFKKANLAALGIGEQIGGIFYMVDNLVYYTSTS